LKFFTVLKYFLSFGIFEQLELALKKEFALKFSSRGSAAPPPPPRLVRHWAAMFLFAPYKTRWQYYFFSVFDIVCFFSHRDLLLSAVAASLHYLPQMSAFKSHMHQNACCRNFEPLLACYCYALMAIFQTIPPQVSQPASAGSVADLVNCKLISHHCVMPEQ